MPTENYEIVGSYNNQRVSTIDSERTVNMFEYVDPLGKKPKSLLPTSGLKNTDINFGDASGGFRGQFVFFDQMYVVIGADVFLINSSLSAIKINSSPLATESGYVGIDANNATHPQIIFVDGLNGYIWDTVLGVWTQITDTAFPTQPIDVCFLDGFFVVAAGGTNLFYLSMINQGLVWSGATDTFTMSTSTANIVLTSGSNLNYQIGTAVTFTGGSLPSEITAGDTYYVVAKSGTTIIQVSATQGGTPITSTLGGSGSVSNNGQLQQGQINSHPGNIVACRTLHRRIFLFSVNYTEVWENAGIGVALPFRRNNALLMEYGTPAIGSVSVGFDRLFFLSQDKDGLGSVMQVYGTDPIPISTRALDFTLQNYASDITGGVSDARGVMVKENGLIFYRLNFTAANHTFVYGVSMSDPENLRWHEEEILNGDRHPAQTHGYFNGVNYYGDYQNPIMYIVDTAFSTNDGEAIRRMRIARPFCPAGYQRIRIDRFQVDLLQGDSAQDITTDNINLLTQNGLVLVTQNNIPLITSQEFEIPRDTTPYVFLSLSKDGGQSYGYEVKAPMGEIGERTFRTLWRKLGTTKRGQAFVPRIQFFNDIPFIVLGASWSYEVLPE